ncbi:unnamed protein product [Schistocephalus solidus]|uniref:C2H2-type domain-containing protein n=1 Tax=Schistocephalus solidus TaxID=70667 RepID=A0A183TRP6_SCHSO|nr:unnamed protein product [Schistocephalus solidus]
MGPLGHMRIYDSGIYQNVENADTSCTPSAPANLTDTAYPTTTNEKTPAPPDFSCTNCARKFTSRISLVSHLRIHPTEAVEPVPGAPT